MPDHETHNLFDVFFFGCAYGQFQNIHDILDHPWVNLFGKEHRRLMHDEKTVQWIEQVYGPAAAIAARAHIACDMAFSDAKRKGRV